MNTSVASANQPDSKLIKWVNRTLVVAIAYAIASLTIQFIPEVSGNKSRSLSTGAANNYSTASQGNLSPTQLGKHVVSSHLFGMAGSKPVEAEKVVATDAPETKLNLTLAGVFAYTPQEMAIAIISSGGRDESVYGVGDKIVGNATLKAVYEDRVIIENRGREETLKLPVDVAPIALPRASSRPVSSASSSGQSLDLPSTPRELRDKLVKNPSMLGKIVSATPYQENGKLVGFRLQPKQNPEILEAQGIMANDIITQVNGISLNSQKQGIRALRKLVKADNIDLTILRDGIEIPIAISLNQ